MPNFTASQVELNLNSYRFTLARRLKTAEVRQLIKQLANKELTAQNILQQGRDQALEIRTPCGVLIIPPDSSTERNRLWQ